MGIFLGARRKTFYNQKQSCYIDIENVLFRSLRSLVTRNLIVQVSTSSFELLFCTTI